MMTESRVCSACGATIPRSSRDGVCEKCLLKAGLDLTAGEVHLQIRCPHCRNAIELIDDSPFVDITCPSCDSKFSLIGDQTKTVNRNGLTDIAHFAMLEKVGVGGFGTVWKARDKELDRIVAIKVPRQDQVSPTDIEQFMREARAAAQLKHPNIVSVHEVGRSNDHIYIVSDFVEGVNLAAWLNVHPLNPIEAARLCVQVAEALHHAHQAGIIHRDIKPSNIMIDELSEPHIMDFGLAKRDAGEITMTLDGKVLGTPAYMSPEQARGEGHTADARSDVYSLGVILFEMLTGEKPFRGTSRMLLHQVLYEEAPTPRKFNGSIPRDLETICLKCLEKEPLQRYGTAQDLAGDLRRFVDREPIHARPISLLARCGRWAQRHPAIAMLSTSVALLLCLVVGVSTHSAIQAKRRAAEIDLEKKQAISSLVDTLMVAAPENVPDALSRLAPFRDSALPLLHTKYQTETRDKARLHAAFGLAALGQVEQTFLVASIGASPVSECLNIASALHHATGYASLLAEQAGGAHRDLDWPYKAKLAIVALHLGDASLSQDMLGLGSDPIQRTVFVDTFQHLRGPAGEFLDVAKRVDEDSFRSGVALSIGKVPPVELQPKVHQAWGSLLKSWYRNEPSSQVHSAAAWTLQQWAVDLPEIPPSQRPKDGFEWYINSIGMTLVRIAEGTFQRKGMEMKISLLGVEMDEVDAEIEITNPYFICDQEVTVRHFRQFLREANLPQWYGWPAGDSKIVSPTDAHPANQVNWFDAVLFCNWLSRKEGLTPFYERTNPAETIGDRTIDQWRFIGGSNGYRLPAEVEWEYACRSGVATTYCFGDDSSFLKSYASYQQPVTRRGKSNLPNAWGLFDMHGNVAEWCQPLDRHGSPAHKNVLSLAVGQSKRTVDNGVLRGGSIFDAPSSIKFPCLTMTQASDRSAGNGFRIVRTAETWARHAETETD